MQRLGGSAIPLALWISIVGMIVFVAVFAGWWLIFNPVVPHPAIAAILSLAVAMVALLLARFLAEKFATAKEVGARRVKPYYYLTYFFLFMVSGMGTVNAALVLWEGSSVVRQDMAEVRNAYTALDVFSQRTLTSQSYENKRRNLDALLENLHVEIDNPHGGNYCGVGPSANAIIERIRVIVPQMPIIRGTGAIRPCDRARAVSVYQSYATSARATLARDAEFLAFNGPQKAIFRDSLARNVNAVKTSFEVVEGLLGDPTAFARSEVQQPLATAAANYGEDYSRLAGLTSPVDGSIPESVDVSQSQELGSFAAFFEILASRLGDIKTWIYLLIAILLDLGLVYFLTQAFRRYRRKAGTEVLDPYRRLGRHPKFLWVNPPIDNERTIRHV